MVKQISVVVEILDIDEIEFLKRVKEFIDNLRKEKGKSTFPRIVGTHTKLLYNKP